MTEKKSFIKPGTRGSAISAGAQAELERQDTARREGRERIAGMDGHQRDALFRSSFAASIGRELELVRKWGASADVDPRTNEVRQSLGAKYPPYTPGRFMRWLMSFKNKLGASYVQYNPAPRGFIFNEGGRGVTLTMTAWVPFRLYVGGWTLTRNSKGQWALRRR